MEIVIHEGPIGGRRESRAVDVLADEISDAPFRIIGPQQSFFWLAGYERRDSTRRQVEFLWNFENSRSAVAALDRL